MSIHILTTLECRRLVSGIATVAPEVIKHINLSNLLRRRNLSLLGELCCHVLFLYQLSKRHRAAARQAEQIVHGLGLRHIDVFIFDECDRATVEQARCLALFRLVLLMQGSNLSVGQRPIDPLAKRDQDPPVELAFRRTGQVGYAGVAQSVVQGQHGLVASLVALDLLQLRGDLDFTANRANFLYIHRDTSLRH